MSLTVNRLRVVAPGANECELLHGLSFFVRPGEIVGILGHAGSGKSVLVSAMAGAMRPAGGSIEMASGENTDRVPVAGLLERPEAMFVASTAAQEVAFALDLLGLPPDCRKVRQTLAFSAVGLDPAIFSERDPHSLSTGEQRRLALAVLLAVEPAYLCLDEPVAGLDLDGREDVEAVLKNLRAAGIGILVAGRDSEFLWRVSDRLSVLDDGSLTAFADTASPGAIVKLMQDGRFELPDELALWAMLSDKGLIPPNIPATAAAMAAALLGDPKKGCDTPWR